MNNPHEKIRVMHLVEGFHLGGAEKKLLELTERIDRTRFDVIVCSLGLGDEIGKQFECLREQGIEVLTIPRVSRLDLRLLFRLVRLLKEYDIDVVLTTLFYADVMGPIAGRLAGVKRVYSWETISAPEWLIPRRLIPYKAAIRFGHKVISVSHATAGWLVEKRGVPKDHIVVIPYGVDLNKYKIESGEAIRRELGIARDRLVIGMVGRLHVQKGHVYLIEAAERLAKQFPNLLFVLVGDGPLGTELKDLVRQKNLDGHFQFLGFRHDVDRLLHAFDIFTLPSLYEGLPNVILEAMACGKPVVASHVDGSKELIVPDETGLLVDPKDVDQLVKALSQLIDNPTLLKQMGQAGRKRVEEVYSLKKQIEAFEAMYSSVD